MKTDYIIVQAGGKGTRLEHLTHNRPKALVPVNNLPILFHLFRKYPDKKYIIIGDYKEDVLRKYLAAFADVKYLVVGTDGNTGTCSGIKKALSKLPANKAFILIWSDLVLPDDFEIPDEECNYLGISKDFLCRWSYQNESFEEIPSENCGVAGFFVFQEKRLLNGVPENGEFVKWLKNNKISFKILPLFKTKEFGLLETIDIPKSGKCRPFNKITIKGNKLCKEGIDAQGKELSVREKTWYKYVEKLELVNIPKIYAYEPSIIMEKINGKNVFCYELSHTEKSTILMELVKCLKNLHSYERKEPDYFSIKKAYFTKTVERLEKIRNMIPYSNEPFITVNEKKCRNVFWHLDELEKRIDNLECKHFQLIHGDCTFSNIILKDDIRPILIDPRGYFGYSEIYGDPLYDWAKLYYSLYGNYDQFNLRHFQLDISKDGIILNIDSNHWEDMQKEFFELIHDIANEDDIKLIHAIIWLSLTTYTWEDYDSICGAFYNGLYYLEDVLN